MLSINQFIDYALEEDLKGQDITSLALIDESRVSEAHLIAKEDGVLSGIKLFNTVFEKLGGVEVSWDKNEGDSVSNKDLLAILKGNTRNILSGERVALNFLQHLSGIASITKKCMQELKGSKIKVLDTRKTLPLYRDLQKQAVLCGGGENHRFGLYDMFLIKENHITIAGSIQKAVSRAKSFDSSKKIEVETETIEDVKEAIKTDADIIMLDNMSKDQMKEACNLIRENSDKKIEASGNMSLEKLKEIKDLDLDYISMGSLTHSVKALDISLLMQKL